MLTLLALMAQTTTLDADPFSAARSCAMATTIAQAGQKSPMQLTSQFTYYTMHAAVARREGKSFTARLGELSSDVDASEIDPTAAAALVSQCEARFPRPTTIPPALLPSDPFTRDVMCFAVLSLLQGAAEEMVKDGDSASLASVRTALRPLEDKFTDAELARRDLGTTEKFMPVFDDQLQLSAALGDPVAVATACGAKGL